ncbi:MULTISPECIES: hypothetical protein [Methylobacteriaceae]|uniref:hypothetical protein n=1 Tax=Methylobacteriaceae TaxID=119045 RepID=UPI003D025D82
MAGHLLGSASAQRWIGRTAGGSMIGAEVVIASPQHTRLDQPSRFPLGAQDA